MMALLLKHACFTFHMEFSRFVWTWRKSACKRPQASLQVVINFPRDADLCASEGAAWKLGGMGLRGALGCVITVCQSVG